MEIEEIFEKFSLREIEEELAKRKVQRNDFLTIIPDDSLHRIPEDLLIGEKYIMSRGNLNADSDQSLNAELMIILKRLEEKLKEKSWSGVRLILSGHCILSVSAKMLVYRITHIETEDLAYFSDGGYRFVSIKTRKDFVS